MEERNYRIKVSNIKLEVTIRVDFFQIRRFNEISSIMSHIQKIHQHSAYEVFIVLDGSLNVSDEQESHDYTNSVVIIPPHYNHYTSSNIINGYGFYFLIEENSKENSNSFFSVQEKLANKINSFTPDESTIFYIKHLADNIGKQGTNEISAHLISLLFSNFFERLGISATQEETVNSNSKYRNYIHDIDSYITNHISGKLFLQDLADKLYLCPKQVSRIIKKEYGCSFPELVNRKRLTIACMLLKHTNLSIKQVASTVGYEYENYFYKIFKENYNINPTQYRKENSIEDTAKQSIQ